MHPGAVLSSLLALAAAGGAWCWLLYERQGEARVQAAEAMQRAQIQKAKDEEREALLDKAKQEKQEALEAAKPPPTPAEVAERVRAARDLAFVRVPEFVAVPSEEIMQRLAAQAVTGVTPEMAEARLRAALAMGFADTEFDYRAALVNLAQAKPGGAWDAATGRFYFQSDASLARADSRELFAGALLPVLLAQNFPLPPAEPDNDDALLAMQSLARGDASFSRVRYSLGDQARTNYDKGQAPALAPPLTGPQFLHELWKLSEDAGNLFVQALHQKGGPAAVNAAYTRPPRSTAEILHAEQLYAATPPFVPVPVQFADTTVNGVAALFTNVAGEAGAYFLVRKWHDVDQSETATVGWAGDRYIIWPGSKAHGDHVLWRSVWTTEKDAEEFFAATRSGLMSRLLIPWQKEYDAVPQQFRVDDPHRILRLRRDGKTVTLLNATDPAFAKAAEEKFAAP